MKERIKKSFDFEWEVGKEHYKDCQYNLTYKKKNNEDVFGRNTNKSRMVRR